MIIQPSSIYSWMPSIIIITLFFFSDTPGIVSWVSSSGKHEEADLLAGNLLGSALQNDIFREWAKPNWREWAAEPYEAAAKASAEELWSWAFPSCINKALDSAAPRRERNLGWGSSLSSGLYFGRDLARSGGRQLGKWIIWKSRQHPLESTTI